MDDRIFFGVLVYILGSVLFIPILPDSFFIGSKPNIPDELVEGLSNPNAESNQISYINKVIRFTFAPFKIDGIPVLVGIMILFMNIMTSVIGVVYVYDKIRGIG